MNPELDHTKLKEFQSKEEPKQSFFHKWFSKLKSYVIPSDKGETKHLPALAVYLDKYHKMLTGRILCKSPIEIITDIIHIFNSLYHSFFDIDKSSRQAPNCSDVQKVSAYFCVCHPNIVLLGGKPIVPIIVC